MREDDWLKKWVSHSKNWILTIFHSKVTEIPIEKIWTDYCLQPTVVSEIITGEILGKLQIFVTLSWFLLRILWNLLKSFYKIYAILVATSMVRRQIAVTHNLNGKVMDLEDYDAFKGTLDGSPNLVIDFHAEWCGPCKMLGTCSILSKLNFSSKCANFDWS